MNCHPVICVAIATHAGVVRRGGVILLRGCRADGGDEDGVEEGGEEAAHGAQLRRDMGDPLSLWRPSPLSFPALPWGPFPGPFNPP